MAKQVLITGGHGFIGQHLTRRLKQQGYNVIHISHQSLKDGTALAIIEKLKDIELIFHLSAYGNHSTQTDEFETISANISGTYNLLQATKHLNYKAFVNFGTSSEYGHKEQPMKETDVLEPDTFYAATKAAATHICRAFSKQYNKPVVTIRPFSVYGPGEADWRFIPTAIHSMLKKNPMPYIGSPQHDWIYVDNFIDGIMAIVDNIGITCGQVVNIGTGKAITNDEVIKILSYIGDKGIVRDGTYKEMPHHSPTWVADNTRLKALGWEPRHTLEEGLYETYEFYKAKYEK